MDQDKDFKWLEKLTDKIDEMLADPKRVKFNTHKNRKLFFGEIKGMIYDAVKSNTLPNKVSVFRTNDAITRPNPHGQQGFAIMTEGLAARADDVHKNVGDKKTAENPVQKRGMRTW